MAAWAGAGSGRYSTPARLHHRPLAARCTNTPKECGAPRGGPELSRRAQRPGRARATSQRSNEASIQLPVSNQSHTSATNELLRCCPARALNMRRLYSDFPACRSNGLEAETIIGLAKFHYTSPTGLDPHGLICDPGLRETPLGPCGSPTKSVRVRVVEFSLNCSTILDGPIYHAHSVHLSRAKLITHFDDLYAVAKFSK